MQTGKILATRLCFQVLDAIAPPYTPEFVQLVLPMVENEEITGTMRAEGENDPVSEFIGGYMCKKHEILKTAAIIVVIPCSLKLPNCKTIVHVY